MKVPLHFFSYSHKVPIGTRLSHQLLVGSFFGHCLIVKHQNLICVFNRSQSVSDRDNRLAASQLRKRLLNQMLILRIYTGGRLV